MNEEILYGLTGVLAVLLGGITVLIPVIGLTLRFALKPVVETWAKTRALAASESHTDSLGRQVALLEAELQQVQHTLAGIVEAQDFRRSLESGKDV